MKVTVITGGWAGRYLPENPASFDAPDNSTVADLLKTLPIPPEEAGMVAVNGKAASGDHILSDGDSLKIYPVIIGG